MWPRCPVQLRRRDKPQRARAWVQLLRLKKQGRRRQMLPSLLCRSVPNGMPATWTARSARCASRTRALNTLRRRRLSGQNTTTTLGGQLPWTWRSTLVRRRPRPKAGARHARALRPPPQTTAPLHPPSPLHRRTALAQIEHGRRVLPQKPVPPALSGVVAAKASSLSQVQFLDDDGECEVSQGQGQELQGFDAGSSAALRSVSSGSSAQIASFIPVLDCEGCLVTSQDFRL